jgi:hypothetical protein
MVRIAGVIAVATGGAAISGCASTSLVSSSTATRHAPAPVSATTTTLSGSRGATVPESRAGYLAALSAAQDKLATSERSLPPHTATPAALSTAIALLASAIARLAGDLVSIRPPAAVAPAHARFVRIVRSYAAQLSRAARQARQPGAEVQAARALIAATKAASAAFAATVAKIDAELGS